MAGFADERSLGVAEGFFAGFGAVGVDGVGPALGQAGEEVGVVGGGGGGEVVLDPVEGFMCGVVLEPVQGGGDDGRGVRGHRRSRPCPGHHPVGGGPGFGGGPGCGGEGGGEVWPGWWEWFAGDGGGGQDVVGEGEAAAGFADGDLQAQAEELGGVPAPVIGRGHHHLVAGPGGRAGPVGVGLNYRAGPGQARCAGLVQGAGAGGGVEGFDAVGVPPGDPARGPACAGPGCAGFGCGGVVDRLGAGPVHGPRGQELEVFHGAGQALDPGGVIGGFGMRGGCQQVRDGQGGGRQLCGQPVQHVLPTGPRGRWV